MNVGERIQFLRKKQGKSRRVLSELSDVSESAIKQYETNKRQPRLEQLQRIASALGVNVSSLMQQKKAYAFDPTTGSEDEDPRHPREVLLERFSIMLESLDSSSTAENLLIHLVDVLDNARKLPSGQIVAVSRLARLICEYSNLMQQSLSLQPSEDVCLSYLNSYHSCLNLLWLHRVNLTAIAIECQPTKEDRERLERLLYKDTNGAEEYTP